MPEGEKKGEKRDSRRIVQAERRASQETKRRRMEMASANARAVQEIEDKEGGPVYSKGAF